MHRDRVLDALWSQLIWEHDCDYVACVLRPNRPGTIEYEIRRYPRVLTLPVAEEFLDAFDATINLPFIYSVIIGELIAKQFIRG